MVYILMPASHDLPVRTMCPLQSRSAKGVVECKGGGVVLPVECYLLPLMEMIRMLTVVRSLETVITAHKVAPHTGLIDDSYSLCLCRTGMSVTDSLEFVLECYDFDGTGRLTIDEITLAFKSAVTGLCKMEAGGKGVCPRDSDFEAAAIDAFERRAGPDKFKVKVGRQIADSHGWVRGKITRVCRMVSSVPRSRILSLPGDVRCD